MARVPQIKVIINNKVILNIKVKLKLIKRCEKLIAIYKAYTMIQF